MDIIEVYEITLDDGRPEPLHICYVELTGDTTHDAARKAAAMDEVIRYQRRYPFAALETKALEAGELELYIMAQDYDPTPY